MTPRLMRSSPPERRPTGTAVAAVALLLACARVPSSPRTPLMEATKIQGTAAELRASDGALALRIP
ncbi:MAG TPA: hypothetical protein VM753_20505, partial [Anaeromyxobacter sp.]|nr:hypothetical protein [Anaeromyxobacter sp.]